MNRFCLAVFALATLLLPAEVSAQTAAADPHTYNDPAMSYTAPADYTPIPVPSSPPTGFNGTVLQAAFVRHPKQADVTIISLRMDNYNDDLDSYEQQAEGAVRNQGSDNSVFVKKQLTTLPNGMPAYFLSVTVGADAGQQELYEYIWVDGVRGITLSVTGRFGVIDDRSAKKVLGDVSGVAYPRNRY